MQIHHKLFTVPPTHCYHWALQLVVMSMTRGYNTQHGHLTVDLWWSMATTSIINQTYLVRSYVWQMMGFLGLSSMGSQIGCTKVKYKVILIDFNFHFNNLSLQLIYITFHHKILKSQSKPLIDNFSSIRLWISQSNWNCLIWKMLLDFFHIGRGGMKVGDLNFF